MSLACLRAILADGLRSSSGRVAQLGERGVRNAEVEGSNPFASTRNWPLTFVANQPAMQKARQNPAGDVLRPLDFVPEADLSAEFGLRQSALWSQLEKRSIGHLIVTKPANIFYLTGFHGSAGIAIFGPGRPALLVDPRYTLQAQSQGRGVEVTEVRDGLLAAAGKWLRKRRAPRIGFEAAHLTVKEFETLRQNGPPKARWVAASGIAESLREVKSGSEAVQIRNACELTAAAFAETLPLIRPGECERDLALEIDFRMRRMGADGTAFETIVASGARAAFPHACPTAKRLEPRELVIFDLGAILGGYAADMTRTVYLGGPDRRVRRLYESVLHAQEAAIADLRGGVSAGNVDAAARRRLAKDRLDQYFTHSTGHGVGIEIHESPRIGKGEKAVIAAGSVVTIEPGIYIEGFGGIRIEDTVLVSEDGAQVLTPASKARWHTD